MVWWVWYFELLLVPLVIHLHEAELGEAVLEANAVESDAPHLDSDTALAWSSGIDLLEETLLDNELSHGLLGVRVSLLSLL